VAKNGNSQTAAGYRSVGVTLAARPSLFSCPPSHFDLNLGEAFLPDRSTHLYEKDLCIFLFEERGSPCPQKRKPSGPWFTYFVAPLNKSPPKARNSSPYQSSPLSGPLPLVEPCRGHPLLISRVMLTHPLPLVEPHPLPLVEPACASSPHLIRTSNSSSGL